jgi:NAD-dependent dihydropyrimidine dehydrogenase PreA subunit
MIVIHTECCDGFGACIEVCPTGALYLVDGKATVDRRLCRDCQACIAACPTEAIRSTEPVTTSAAEPVRVPVVRPEPEHVLVETYSPVPLRANVLPVVGTTLVWTARKIVPRLADYYLDSLDRRAARRRARGVVQHTSGTDSQTGRDDGGRRHRRRRRRN